jgi:hypothetical protein
MPKLDLPSFQPVRLDDFEMTSFRNTKRRMHDRYGLDIDLPLYRRLNLLIKTNSHQVLFLGPFEGLGTLYRIRHAARDIFVLVRDRHIVSAIENTEGRFDALVAVRESELLREEVEEFRVEHNTLRREATLRDVEVELDFRLRLRLDRQRETEDEVPPIIRLLKRRKKDREGEP